MVIVFKIGYRLAEKEMRSAAGPSRQISSTGKIAKDKNKFKVCVKMGYNDVGDGGWWPNVLVTSLRY